MNAAAKATDQEFEEHRIEKIEGDPTNGWFISFDGGLAFGVRSDSPVEPKVGMTARFYGRGFGSTVRGLDLDGQTIFYRTEEEDRAYSEEQLYGLDAAEWLRRWDGGRSVWSVEMGGLGPGYEQVIQILAAEMLRAMLAASFDSDRWTETEAWTADRKLVEARPEVKAASEQLGPSGAQWGAAMSLAAALYMHGPIALFSRKSDCPKKVPEDRKIQVSKDFPKLDREEG